MITKKEEEKEINHLKKNEETNQNNEIINQDFNIEINKKKELIFPYKDLSIETITFNNPIENEFTELKFSKPTITNNGKFLGIIGSSGTEDTVFIWKLNNIEKPIYKYKSKNIFRIDFAINNNSFIIIKYNEITHYNIKKGNKIVDLELDSIINDGICTSFSESCKYYSLATEKGLYIWDILIGKNVLYIEEESPLKYINMDIIISISENADLKIITMDSEPNILSHFKIENIEKYNELLSCLINKNKDKIFYIIKSGIYFIDIDYSKGVKYQFNSQILFKFDEYINNNNICAGNISYDCNNFFVTDKETIYFFNIEKGFLDTLPKPKFTDYYYSFKYSKLILVDDYQINITNFNPNKKQENRVKDNNNPINIYFNKTFNSIYSFKYIEKYNIFLIIDEHNICIFDTDTKKLIQKWHNETLNWYKSISISPEESMTTLISIKTSNNIVFIYDYIIGNEIIPLIGLNTYSSCFSDDGFYIALGCIEGDIICMLWNLNDITSSFALYNKGEKNLNTNVKFINNSNYLICVSDYQKPLLFDVESKNIVKIFKSDVCLDFINEIHINEDEIFYIKGLKDKIPYGIIFSIKNDENIKVFEYCEYIELSKDCNYCITKIINKANPDEFKVNIWDFNLNNYKMNSKEIFLDVDNNFLLNDNLSMCSIVYSNINEKRFVLTELNSGQMIGEIVYSQLDKDKQYIMELKVSKSIKNNLILRRFEFK